MNKFVLYCLFLIVSFSSLSFAADNQYQDIKWEELIPASDLDALINAPMDQDAPDDGAADDVLNSPLDNSTPAAETASAFQKALRSTNTIKEFDGKKIRLPGFIVPLEFNKDQQATAFFLVPYFGACIHLPPPPPNQIVYVTYPKGINQETLQTAYWIEGEIKTDEVLNDFTKAAYSMKADNISIYTEE